MLVGKLLSPFEALSMRPFRYFVDALWGIELPPSRQFIVTLRGTLPPFEAIKVRYCLSGAVRQVLFVFPA